jgi:ligand-binding sensor domain-containing protein
MFTRVEQASTFNGSLQQYFENELKGLFQDLNGIIQLQILIDTSGKACCMSVNNTFSGVSSAKIKDAVNKMTGWIPAKQNNHSVNFSAVLQIIFTNSKLSVNYVNEKPLISKPVLNTNKSNNPEIVKERKTKSIWKLWNFSNSMIPANLSRNVAMDTNGAIWCCTDNGLVKITDDGHWEIFNGMNVQALSGKNNITWTTGVVADKANNVWVKSFDYVVRYDGRNWTRFDTSNSPLKLVNKICVDKNGTIWFCTFQGLVKYNGKSWTKYNTSNSKIASDNVKEVYLGNDETIWIATDKGINKVINGNWSLLNNGNSNIPENDVTSIKGDLAGNIWAGLGTRDKNYLIKIDTTNNISVFPSGVIWNITVDNNADKIWLATNGRGLVSFDGKEFTQYDKSNSIIPNNTVSDILIDNNGDKWVSTFGGLVFTNKK